jgi:hypothetical protein
MKTKILAAAVATLVISASSALAQQITWNDNFESYADTAALSGPYTQLYPSAPFMLDTAKGYNSAQSIHSGIHANYLNRMYINLPSGPRNGTDLMPLKVEFMIDTDVNIWSTREYIELRSYSGGAYNVGSLNQIIALGFTSSGVDTSRINQRVLYGYTGTAWGNLTANYATRATVAAAGNDWTKLGMVIKSSTVEFYVNDNLDTIQTMTSGVWFDSLVIGSGLSTTADVWFDNIVVTVPEPSTFALGLVGGLGLLCVLRRRTV